MFRNFFVIPKYAREVASGKFSVSCNCKKLPVINSVGYIGDDKKYYEQGDESEYSDYISNYKILQYNNVIDYKNRYENFFSTDNLVD